MKRVVNSLKTLARKSLLVAACLVAVSGKILTPSLASALDENFYGSNDILFYDPNGCSGGGASSITNTSSTPMPAISDSGTLDQKIAKLFIVGFTSSDTAGMEAAVTKYKIGGLFFHGHSNGGLNKAFFDGLNQKAGFPLLITSDDEGGQITRFVPNTPSAATMGTWDDAKIEAQGKQVGQTLAAAGVTSALAPVLDLNGGNTIWTQHERDWSANPDVVADKAGAWARGLKSAGVNPVYKHFPGLGLINVDTDQSKAAPVSLASLQNGLKPFQALVNQNGGALMLGNIYVNEWNAGTVPASLSSDAVQYARGHLGFNGLIMTDDLSAKYIENGNIAAAVAKAVNAGVDAPLFTGSQTTIQQAIDAVKQLPDAEAKVNTALQRVTAYRTNLAATAPSANPCCSTASGAGGTTLSGDNNAAKAYNFLTSKGLTPAQAAGAVGNIILESGINPQRLQGTGLNVQTPADQAANSSSGWGIVQWTPAGKMINPLSRGHQDPNDLSVQLNYLWNELNSNEVNALNALKATTTPETAAEAFGAKYERPKDLSQSLSDRQTYAKAIYDNSNGVPIPPQVAAHIYGGTGASPATALTTTTAAPAAPSSASACGGSTAATTGYQNPFRDLKNSHVMRLDGGLDYGGAGSGSGPVYAVGNAKVTYLKVNGSGWPGLGTDRSGAYISYELTDGTAKGLSIYIAEDCTPRVKVGDIVSANTVVCDYVDQGTHLEIGWGNGFGSYVGWSDYPNAENGFASNSGQDISKFLTKISNNAIPPGVAQGRLSTTPPPASWPKW